MELDRNVSEYMQKRNMLATKVAGIVSAQLLLIAAFFCALELPGEHDRSITVAMIVLSLLIAASGIIVLYRNRKLLCNNPDDIGLRQSSGIIEYAYKIAGPALVFNMTISTIILLLGVFISLFTSVTAFFLAAAIAVLIFLPSFDRNNAYRKMMSRHIENAGKDRARYVIITATSFMLLMPSSVCICLIWRYFGRSRNDIAWIVFCLAAVLQGALMVLCDNAGKIHKNSKNQNE